MNEETRVSERWDDVAARRVRGVFAAIAAVGCALVLVACQPPGAPKVTQVYETDEFKSAIKVFEWPDKPTHVLALEIKDRGVIRIGLYEEFTPITVAHFVECANRGVYNDTLFHRVIKDFMIQGGDPVTRRRGPDTTRGHWGDLSVADEFVPIHLDRGVVAMANRGRAGSAASQFFIVLSDQRELDGRYTIFGRVLSGMDVVNAIAIAVISGILRYEKMLCLCLVGTLAFSTLAPSPAYAADLLEQDPSSIEQPFARYRVRGQGRLKVRVRDGRGGEI
ncbi:MAG: hypothetical protein COC10_07165 [Sphingobium sp.]|nr:MAG: hypothetical protein COC10_07165 [Sphingobium sp.]